MNNPPIFNEMCDEAGYARPHYEAFDQWLKGISRETVQVKQTEADLIFRRTGITFSLTGDEGGTERGAFELLRAQDLGTREVGA